MINLTFGNGEVGIRTDIRNLKEIILGPLAQPHEIGASFAPEDFQPMLKLIFETEEGLDVLINALQHCKASFVEIPNELRMGA